MYSVEEVNALGETAFLAVFGNVVEHCPGCAEALAAQRPFPDTGAILAAARRYLSDLDLTGKELVIKLHPDLAGQLARDSLLTAESALEQRAAGLDQATEDRLAELSKRNAQYKAKFGFPFVICARDNKFQSIMEGLGCRMNSSRDAELQTAIDEVKKITQHRIQQIVKGS